MQTIRADQLEKSNKQKQKITQKKITFRYLMATVCTLQRLLNTNNKEAHNSNLICKKKDNYGTRKRNSDNASFNHLVALKGKLMFSKYCHNLFMS